MSLSHALFCADSFYKYFNIKTNWFRPHVNPCIVDCSDLPGLGSVLTLVSKFRQLLTCESSECPRLDPAIQGSCCHQRISPDHTVKAFGRWLGIHTHPAPLWSTSFLHTHHQQCTPCGHCPKGSWRQKAEHRAELLTLGGVSVWAQHGRCQEHQKSTPCSTETSPPSGRCLKFYPVMHSLYALVKIQISLRVETLCFYLAFLV